MSTDTEQAELTGDAKILALARKRFKFAYDQTEKTRRAQVEDKKFLNGEQWDPIIKSQREADGDPCLVVNLLKPQIKQITNQQRKMRPSVEVEPVDGGADPETAEVFQGIVRHIETLSDADDAYDQAGRDQTEIGIGWFRILTEYSEDEESANQDIKIQRIRNPFSVYHDPSAQRRDFSDGKFLFETSDWSPEDLRERYPSATLVGTGDFDAIGDDAGYWVKGDRIRVALYWVVSTDRVDKVLAPGKARPVERRTVTCYVMTGLQILERYEWAGKYIPYVPVLGEEVDIEGDVDLQGVVRQAKDPQKHFNYQKSKIAEVMALAPLAPWIMAEGQDEGYEKDWQEAGRRKIPALKYKSVALNGQPAPPPQRNFGEPPIQAMLTQAQAAQNEVRMATGFVDVTDGESAASARQESGRARLVRQQQGEHGNSDYVDGLSRAIRFCGRILVDLIPKIYDAPRVMRILGRDMQPKTVMVHAGNAPADIPEGVKKVYDLSVGRYDVTVSAGPSYQTARQEFADKVAELFKADPPLMQIIGDLYFDNLDIPHAKQIAERLRKIQDPRLRDDKPGDPAAVAQQASQLAQQVQQLQQALAECQKQLETDQAKQQAAIQMKGMDLAFQREKMQADNETKIAVAELGAKVDRLALFLEERGRLGLQAHQADMAAHDRAHDLGMAAVGHAHGQAAADAQVERMPDDVQEAA